MNSRIMQALPEATRASNKVGISCSWFHDSGHWNVIVLLPVGFWPSFASALIGWSLWGLPIAVTRCTRSALQLFVNS